MGTLIADRFLIRRDVPIRCLTTGRGAGFVALDLATGNRVRLHVGAAGNRSDQQAWIDERARFRGSVIDYGFLGTSQKFEAVRRGRGMPNDVDAPASASVLDWLDSCRPASSRILYLQDLPDPRDIRLRGFVPCDLCLFEERQMTRAILMAAASRSLTILDRRDRPSLLSLALLRLQSAGVREVRVLVKQSRSACLRVQRVAEGKAIYDGRAASDPRVRKMVGEAERLAACGRHSAAEQILRAAMAAFERRSDTAHSAETGMTLGCLLLSRGRAADARHEFEKAENRFDQVRAPARAVDAAIHAGLSLTDLQQFADAERTCRAAYSAASALGRADLTAGAGVALARVHVWQHRYGDARALLESLAPVDDAEICARRMCLHARVFIAANALGDAWRVLERARPTRGTSATIEALVRTWEAAVQAKLGDLEALKIHVSTGLEAARTARRPGQAMRLRLTLAEGLIAAGKLAQARAASRHLARIRAGSIPALLKMRVDAVSKALEGSSSTQCLPLPGAAHEPVSYFQSTVTGSSVEDLDALRQLLSLTHQIEDEREALTRAAQAIGKHTHAIGAGIYAYRTGEIELLAQHGACNAILAKRAADAGATIRPERVNGWVEGAVPVQYLGRSIGALAVRWSIEGPENIDRAIAFVLAAAAASAPVLYVQLERHGPQIPDEPTVDLAGVSSAIEEVRKAVRRAANAPFSVLIEGESGSGKELVARAVHRGGCRRERSFAALNCAAMPEDLIDAELFGHAKGAFTGAATERMGLFEGADGGTVFLDEVGELSARAQAKILRVLQEGEIRRIGENFTRSFDARLIAATNRSLRGEVEAGRFRQDLLYRLDVIRITVPPLRERVEDVPLLAAAFWRQCAKRVGSKAVLGQQALSALARYDWPGNVRELQNVLAALVVAVPPRGVIGVSALPAAVARAVHPSPHESLDNARLRFEQRFVRAALARAAGHRGRTAAALGLSRQGLAKLMQRLQLDA